MSGGTKGKVWNAEEFIAPAPEEQQKQNELELALTDFQIEQMKRRWMLRSCRGYLTQPELIVVKMLIVGHGMKQIADFMQRNIKTVDRWLQNARARCGMRTTMQLAVAVAREIDRRERVGKSSKSSARSGENGGDTTKASGESAELPHATLGSRG